MAFLRRWANVAPLDDVDERLTNLEERVTTRERRAASMQQWLVRELQRLRQDMRSVLEVGELHDPNHRWSGWPPETANQPAAPASDASNRMVSLRTLGTKYTKEK